MKKEGADRKRRIAFLVLFLLVLTNVLGLFLYPPSLGGSGEEKAAEEEMSVAAPLQIDIPQEASFGWDKRLSLSSYETFVYDRAGNQVGTYRYGTDGALDYYEEWSYDAQGNRIREAYEYLMLSGGVTEYRYQYEYDDSGRVIRETAYEGDRVAWVSDTRYEGEYTLCATSFPDADGTVSSGYSSVQNADGVRLLYYGYDENGEKTSFQTALCDERGRIIRQTTGHGDGTGEPMRELITEWDDETYTSRETSYEPVGHVNAIQYNTYTEDWNQLEGVRYVSGYQGHDASEWNSRLQFTEGCWAGYEGDRKLWEFRYAYQEISYYRMYDYDGAGNCVTELEYDNDNHMNAAYVYRCRYDEDGQLRERYTYRIRSDFAYTAEDGAVTSMKFDDNGHLAAVTRNAGDGAVDHEYLFDGDGKLEGEYLWSLGRFQETGETEEPD